MPPGTLDTPSFRSCRHHVHGFTSLCVLSSNDLPFSPYAVGIDRFASEFPQPFQLYRLSTESTAEREFPNISQESFVAQPIITPFLNVLIQNILRKIPTAESDDFTIPFPRYKVLLHITTCVIECDRAYHGLPVISTTEQHAGAVQANGHKGNLWCSRLAMRVGQVTAFRLNLFRHRC